MSLWDQAQEVFDAVVAEIGPAEVPDRRFVSSGRPAFDQCPQLTLHLVGFTVGTPPQERPSRLDAPTTSVWQLTRTWCIPVGDGESPPSKAEEVDAAQEVTLGAHQLWVATLRAVRDHHCRPSVEGAAPVDPSGGQVAWGVTISWVPTA